MACDYSPYTLPAIDFVGGSTQELVFHGYFYANKRPIDLAGCTANFSIINFVGGRGSTPILSKPMQIIAGDYDAGERVTNLLKVTLLPNETYELYGKYIYQISIKKNASNIDIPNQGVIYIADNINKRFISG